MHGGTFPASQSLRWRKSSFSGPQGGECVEVAEMDGGAVAMRNSRDPHGPVVVHTRAQMSAFLRDVKAGLLDAPAG